MGRGPILALAFCALFASTRLEAAPVIQQHYMDGGGGSCLCTSDACWRAVWAASFGEKQPIPAYVDEARINTEILPVLTESLKDINVVLDRYGMDESQWPKDKAKSLKKLVEEKKKSEERLKAFDSFLNTRTHGKVLMSQNAGGTWVAIGVEDVDGDMCEGNLDGTLSDKTAQIAADYPEPQKCIDCERVGSEIIPVLAEFKEGNLSEPECLECKKEVSGFGEFGKERGVDEMVGGDKAKEKAISVNNNSNQRVGASSIPPLPSQPSYSGLGPMNNPDLLIARAGRVGGLDSIFDRGRAGGLNQGGSGVGFSSPNGVGNGNKKRDFRNAQKRVDGINDESRKEMALDNSLIRENGESELSRIESCNIISDENADLTAMEILQHAGRCMIGVFESAGEALANVDNRVAELVVPGEIPS